MGPCAGRVPRQAASGRGCPRGCGRVRSGTVHVLGCRRSRPLEKGPLLGPTGFLHQQFWSSSRRPVSHPSHALRLVSPLWHLWAMSCWSLSPLFLLHSMAEAIGVRSHWCCSGCAVGVGFVCFGFFFLFLSRKHLMFSYFWLPLPLEIWQRRQPRVVLKCQTGQDVLKPP